MAQALNFSRSLISNTVGLLELAKDIQEAIVRGQITMGHAKVLLSVSDPKEQRLLFEKIAEEKLTVRELEDVREVSDSAEVDGEAAKRGKKVGARRKSRTLSAWKSSSASSSGHAFASTRKKERGGSRS